MGGGKEVIRALGRAEQMAAGARSQFRHGAESFGVFRAAMRRKGFAFSSAADKSRCSVDLHSCGGGPWHGTIAPMLLRSELRHKDGEEDAHWSLVEIARTPDESIKKTPPIAAIENMPRWRHGRRLAEPSPWYLLNQGAR